MSRRLLLESLLNSKPQLEAPTISLSGNTLTISAIANAEYYDIYVDTILNTSISLLTFDLSTLQLNAGTHSIQVKARATGYEDSEFSNIVTYNAPITNLQGTVWRFKDSGIVGIQNSPDLTFNLEFYSADLYVFDEFTISGLNDPIIVWRSTSDGINYFIYNSPISGPGWIDEYSKTVTFTGGTDLSNTTFINWLQANATRLT